MFFPWDPIHDLDEEQSWKLLDNTQHARIVLTAAGATELFPINYRAHDGILLLRTAPGTKPAELPVTRTCRSKPTSAPRPHSFNDR
jgi:hypothetical protein